MNLLYTILIVSIWCATVMGDEIIASEDLKGLKEITSKIGDRIVNLTKQQITDLGTVMKQQESVLECDGKQCPNNNIFIFYECCSEDSGDCCWHLRYWLTIVFILVVLKILISFLIWCCKRLCC